MVPAQQHFIVETFQKRKPQISLQCLLRYFEADLRDPATIESKLFAKQLGMEKLRGIEASCSRPGRAALKPSFSVFQVNSQACDWN